MSGKRKGMWTLRWGSEGEDTNSKQTLRVSVSVCGECRGSSDQQERASAVGVRRYVSQQRPYKIGSCKNCFWFFLQIFIRMCSLDNNTSDIWNVNVPLPIHICSQKSKYATLWQTFNTYYSNVYFWQEEKLKEVGGSLRKASPNSKWSIITAQT